MSRSGTPFEDLDLGDSWSPFDVPPPSDAGSSVPRSAGSMSASVYVAPGGRYAYGLVTPTRTPSGVPPTPSSVASSSVGPSPSLPRLPALFPGLPGTGGGLFDEMSEPTMDRDAPRGPHGWPMRYVIDMAIGFQSMRRYEDQGMPRGIAFKEAFYQDYKTSTFSDNFRGWQAAGLIDGEVESWMVHGRQAAGEWALFMKKWRQPRNSRR